MVGPGSTVPSNHEFFPIPIAQVGSTTTKLITISAALRLSSFIGHRLRLRFRLPSSSFKYIPHLDHLPPLPHVWHEKAFQLTGFNIIQFSYDTISSKCMSLHFFKGNEDKSKPNNRGKGSGSPLFNRRKWTNILLAVNIVVFLAQFATQGRLLFWGAKINGLIDKGQFWRLITSSLLHANVGHLMVNCYSLNSIGPTVENISGPKRFLAVYTTSAIASSAMSYCLCKAPAVGASGAIFGLVGSFAVFVLRHKGIVQGSDKDLQHIMRIIILNMVIGILSKGIDNWGHVRPIYYGIPFATAVLFLLMKFGQDKGQYDSSFTNEMLGGLLGGAATSWLLGPAWKLESVSSEGCKVFVDSAPIFKVMKIARTR